MSNKFSVSSVAALTFLNRLVEGAMRDAERLAAPQLLELQTICREAGLHLSLLDVFSAVCDREPAVLICGGDEQTASDVAHCFGLRAVLPPAVETPLLWWVKPGEKNASAISVGNSYRELSENALHVLLDSELPMDRMTVLAKQVESESSWRAAWIADPELLSRFMGWPALLEAMMAAQVVVVIGDDVPQNFAPWLSRPGLVTFQFAATEICREDVRGPLLSQLCALREQGSSEHQSVLDATWQFLSPRLLDSLDALRQQYTLEIDRQNGKVQTTRQMLGEYRRNWMSGIRNLLNDYMTKKDSGQAFATLLDPKQTGPQAENFLQAVAMPTLNKRLTEMMTDRMAEFVQGLSALATRVDLRSIPLKDLDTVWNPAPLASQIEDELSAKSFFTKGGGERAGLVSSLMGRSEEIVQLRKTQLARASKLVQQSLERDFQEWCDNFLHTVEQRVRVQIAAAQINQGLPDHDALRRGLEGIDRLTTLLEGRREGSRAAPAQHTTAWLGALSKRRWFRRYSPAAA